MQPLRSEYIACGAAERSCSVRSELSRLSSLDEGRSGSFTATLVPLKLVVRRTHSLSGSEAPFSASKGSSNWFHFPPKKGALITYLLDRWLIFKKRPESVVSFYLFLLNNEVGILKDSLSCKCHRQSLKECASLRLSKSRRRV